MKIGIMSMQRIDNYGSFLQAYALKKIIEDMGHECVFIDYLIEPCIVKEPPVKTVEHSKLYYFIRKIYYFIKDAWEIVSGKKAREKKIDSMRLRIKYSEYAKELGITDTRTENIPVDLLIIGSDEVFNCLQTNPAVGYSKQLFGENVKAKRVITYAASAGFTTVDKLNKYGIKDEIGYMLKNNFSRISVRDDNTYELVQELTEIMPEMHLDPVLVGDFSECVIEKNDLQKYLVVYSYEERMSNNITEANAIQKFAHSKGLKTVSIGNFQTWTDLKIEANPYELLGYIKNADYVVTDTFHGTIFSIIMKKQFATIVRDSNKQKLTALLEKMKLFRQKVDKLSDLEEILTREIDYRKTDEIRMSEREKTYKYLKEAISE